MADTVLPHFNKMEFPTIVEKGVQYLELVWLSPNEKLLNKKGLVLPCGCFEGRNKDGLTNDEWRKVCTTVSGTENVVRASNIRDNTCFGDKHQSKQDKDCENVNNAVPLMDRKCD